MKEEWVKKWIVRVEHLYLSNGYITEWFNFQECEVYDYGGDDESIEDGDMLDDGSMYKGKIVNYTEFLDMIGAEVINTVSEDYHILDSLESGREKFNELIKNTWSKDDSETLAQVVKQQQEKKLQENKNKLEDIDDKLKKGLENLFDEALKNEETDGEEFRLTIPDNWEELSLKQKEVKLLVLQVMKDRKGNEISEEEKESLEKMNNDIIKLGGPLFTNEED